MTRRGKLITVAGVALALGAGGVGIAVAGSGDDTEEPIRGTALDRASQAALEHTGGGRVTETESGDEESYYEVEVTRPDGSQVDVQLDRAFRVVGGEADHESESGADDD
jgi:uncharacterized membrane protein YkoI